MSLVGRKVEMTGDFWDGMPVPTKGQILPIAEDYTADPDHECDVHVWGPDGTLWSVWLEPTREIDVAMHMTGRLVPLETSPEEGQPKEATTMP